MGFKIKVSDAALNDIDKAVIYYNGKSISLGNRFYRQFRDALRKIKSNPNYYSYYKTPYRRLLLKDFPYLILYKVYNNTVIVTGVFFEIINPEKITDRTK